MTFYVASVMLWWSLRLIFNINLISDFFFHVKIEIYHNITINHKDLFI